MITESESIAIKYIRVGAMLSIVICHVLQVYANRWAFVFNIGVQVFLALSGYLYGKKIVANWKQWTVGRVKRVYAPMFVFLVAVLPFYLIFHRDVFSWKPYALNYLNLQGVAFAMGGGMIQGIRHLWFITAIMFAYLVTPVLQWLSKYANWLFPVLLVCVGISYFVASGPLVFMASWVFLYAIGYLYVNLNKTKKIYNIGLVLLELFLIGIVIFNFDVVTHYFNPVNRFFHDVSGVFVVIIGIVLLSRLKLSKVPKIVNLFDKYSFHVFLVHYFFVVGPFSLAHLTPYVLVNILLIILVTFVASFLFVKLNDIANRYVFDKILKIK
jgi:peptidoglycan/LPS O-acetylase OafA/YrhL